MVRGSRPDAAIRSFGDKHPERFFGGERVARFDGFAEQAVRRLATLNSAVELRDLAMLRSNRFEARNDRVGQYSIRINAQWRICFRWTEDGPHDVEIVDYH